MAAGNEKDVNRIRVNHGHSILQNALLKNQFFGRKRDVLQLLISRFISKRSTKKN